MEDGDEGHGKTNEGAVACCRKYSDGQVNCDSCLDTALKAWVVRSDPKEQVSRRVLAVLDEAGPAGMHISTLIVCALYQFHDDKQKPTQPDEHHGSRRQCRNYSICIGLHVGQPYTSRRSRGPFQTVGCERATVSGLDCYSQ